MSTSETIDHFGGSVKRDALSADTAAQREDFASILFGIFWLYRWQMVALCLIGLVLSSIVALKQGPRYTATAIILPTFRGTEKMAPDAPVPTVDAAMLLESNVRLLETLPISHSIVEQLAKNNPNGGMRADAVEKQLNRRKFTYERRTYLIELAMTAGTPGRAAAYANAVASQFVHDEQQKMLADNYTKARKMFNELTVKFGDKHPTIVREKRQLGDMQALLQAGKEKAALLSDRELEATGLVIAAQASAAKKNSRLPLIFAGPLIALLLSMVLAVFIERDIVRRSWLR